MNEQRVKWNGIYLKSERVKGASHRHHLQVRRGHFPRGTLPFSERWMLRDTVLERRWEASWGGRREKCAQAQVWSEVQVIIIHFWWSRDKWANDDWIFNQIQLRWLELAHKNFPRIMTLFYIRKRNSFIFPHIDWSFSWVCSGWNSPISPTIKCIDDLQF